jgi:site-specific recombinase XerD
MLNRVICGAPCGDARSAVDYSVDQCMTSASPDVQPLLNSWLRALRAANKRPGRSTRTAKPLNVLAVVRSERTPERSGETGKALVQDYMAWLLANRSSGTAGTRYRSLRQWFKSLESEDEVDDCMARMAHPKLDERPPSVISEDHLRALLDSTKGREFKERRDHAIFRLLIDTGMCRASSSG